MFQLVLVAVNQLIGEQRSYSGSSRLKCNYALNNFVAGDGFWSNIRILGSDDLGKINPEVKLV